MKLQQVVNALPAINSLAGQKLSLKALYQLDQLMQVVSAEIVFYQREHLIILRECGKCVRGNEYEIPKEKKEDYDERLKVLLDTEVTADFEPVCLSLTTESVKLSYFELQAIKGFIRLTE